MLGLLLGSAWILFMLAVGTKLNPILSLPTSLALVAGLNLLAAFGCWFWINAATPNLTFRELRALLADSPAPNRERD